MFFTSKLIKQHDKLKAKYDALVDASYKSARDCDVAIDFKLMNAVSVERLFDSDDGMAKTVIGYKVGNENQFTIEEWSFYCSEEIHKKLIQQFNLYLELK